MDKIIEREENKYWKIQVDDFQSWMGGFYKFIGEWETTELEANKILVDYRYSLYSNQPIFYPVNWLFAKIFWRIYMRRVVNIIKVMAYNEEPYLYE